MATLSITIKYQIIGYTQTVSSEGVVTGTSRVALNPGDVSVTWPTVNIEVNPSDFTTENDGQQYIKLDDVFWSKFESIIQQQPADVNLLNLSPAWACKWHESTVQFFVGGSSEPAERLPLDGSAITAMVTGFVDNIPVGLVYKEAISGAQIGDQASDTLNFSLTTLNEWSMTGLPTGWYAASARLDWGSAASSYTVPTIINIPSFFNFADDFKTNTHIPRCMVNTGYSLTVGETTVDHFCRDSATLQVMAVLNFLHKKHTDIPVITVTCHKTNTAPATCSANYTHDVTGGTLLFTSTSTKQLYLSKDHKVNNSTDLFGEWGNDCLTELKKLASVASTSSVTKTDETFNDSITAIWSCNASYKVRATKLQVYLKGGAIIGGASPYMIYDNTSAIVDVGTTKYTDLFTSSTTIKVNSKNVRVFLQEIAGMKPDAAQIVIPYEAAYGATAKTIEASYSAKYSIRLKFISNVGTGDNGLKFYPETRDDRKLQYTCKTVWREFTTDEDALTQSIGELLTFSTQYQTVEGPDFIYCIGCDATLSGYNVTPADGLHDDMKPVRSSFSNAQEQGTNILNTSLETCINSGITEIVFEVTPQLPKAFNVKTHWKLVSKMDVTINTVSNKTLKWFTYANKNKTFSDLCTFYKDNNTIDFKANSKSIPSNQWAISSIANSKYGSEPNKQEEVIPYTSTSLSDLYVLCKKNLDYTTYTINRRDGGVLTVNKDGSDVYQQASLKIPDDKTEITIANDLANQSLLPVLSGGAIIFLSNGKNPADAIFEDWPGFTTMSGADKVFHEGVQCDQLFNVNQGIGMNCQYLKILDGNSGSQNLSSYLNSSTYMQQSTVKRRFFIGMVGAGGGGGGGDLQWFDSNGGCGGGGGGYTLFACTIKNGVTDAEMGTLSISWSGGLGGSNGGRNSSGGGGSTATLTLSITRGGASKTLATFTANGGSGGGAYDSSGGSGAAAPIHSISDSSLISVSTVIQITGFSGQRPKTGTSTFNNTYTTHYNYFELDHSWIGYEISKAIAPTGISTTGGVKDYIGNAYSKSVCDSKTSSIFTQLNSAASSHYNIYQLFPGGFSCSGVYDDNKNGGPGAPSVVGPGSIFSEDGNYGYDRPCPGCGGCGSGHWIQGGLFSGDEDDEVPGRPGGNAMFAILC